MPKTATQFCLIWLVAFLAALPAIRAQSDVTVPSDPIVLVNGSNDGDPDAGPPPVVEGVEHAIDNIGQKYLNFLDLGSGLAVQPRVGPTVVTGLRLYTANDEEPRDPASFLLEGSTNGIAGPWSQIASGPLALPSGRNIGGETPLGGNFQTVTFANATPYLAYRLTFPTLKNAAAANSMQVGEVELLGTVVVPPNGPRNAVNLDGVDDHVVVPGGIWFSSDFTVEGWVHLRSHNNYARLLDFGMGEHNDNVVVVLSSGTSGRPLFQIFSGTDPGLTITAPNPLPLNQWVHLACVLSGTTGTIYVNGVAVASGLLHRPPSVLRARCYLGRSNWSADAYANALFDEVRIWNVARGAEQIQEAMRRQLWGNQAGLTAYYRFDEVTGVTAFDSTGNASNTAFLANGPLWANSTIVPFAAPVATLPAVRATLWGSVDGRTSTSPFEAYFEWGTSPALGNQLRGGVVINPGSLPQNFGLPISGLIQDATYYFRAVAANAHGLSYGHTLAFTFDTTPLACVNAKATPTLRDVMVSFSERADPASALDRFNYSVPGFEVVSVLSDATGTNVIISLDRPMPPGTAYTLTIRDVFDAAGNSLQDSPCQLQFRSLDFIPGYLLFEAYNGTLRPTPNGLIPGDEVSALTNHRWFPHNPSETRYMTAFDTRTVYPDDSHEFYGASVKGVFVPPLSGLWVFYLRSDNASQLFLDSTGPLGENAALIAEETECCHSFSAHGSAPIPLTAGERYFIQVLYKEGVGGDYAQVAVKLQHDPTPPDNLSPIPGAQLAAPAPKPFVLTTVAASDITSSGATLNGLVEPETNTTSSFEVFFEWGETPALGNELRAGIQLSSPEEPIGFSIPLTDLAPSTTFYFRAAAVSADQLIHRGNLLTFKTGEEPPELTIAREVNGRIVISWLTSFTGYQLESKQSLTPGPWTAVGPSPHVVNGRNVVTNTVSDTSRFYRLRKP